MTRRRTLLKSALALAALPLASLAQARPHLVVYRTPGCGCCGGWQAHMRAAGFRVESHMLENLAAMRRQLGVPDSLASCHTAVTGGYVVEGHVPAADVQRLLRERPRAIGLAAPGMPVDAPGMDQRRGEPYEVVAFDARRSWRFARH